MDDVRVVREPHRAHAGGFVIADTLKPTSPTAIVALKPLGLRSVLLNGAAGGGRAPQPLIAGLAMALSSVSVVGNALRLRRFQR